MFLKIILFVLISIEFVLGNGRPPQKSDQILCRVQMFERLETIRESQDPNAKVIAYMNRTGFVCKTYCRIISINKELAKITQEFDSPFYTQCGGEDQYCSLGGKCKHISHPLKIDAIKETTQNSSQSSNTIKTSETKPEVKPEPKAEAKPAQPAAAATPASPASPAPAAPVAESDESTAPPTALPAAPQAAPPAAPAAKAPAKDKSKKAKTTTKAEETAE